MNIKELEKTLWETAKKLRSNMDSVTHMHIVLGLVFLKYITDAFNRLHENVIKGEESSAVPNPSGPEKFLPHDPFCLPEKAQWTFLQSHANHPDIGILIDNAIETVEKLNVNLKGILSKNYANPGLDKPTLGELVRLLGNRVLNKQGQEKKYLPGHIYEYLLERFAEEGKNDSDFYTPPSISKLLVEMLEPHKGRIYDGCCGSGGMFIQSEKFIKEHHSKIADQLFYGQDVKRATLKLAKMNLGIHGIDADLHWGDVFTNDCHPELQADFILAHPPFNMRHWQSSQLMEDKDWKYTAPPMENANYAWLQHFISKLSRTGTAGIVLAAGSMYSKTGKEGEIRRKIIEDKLVDCMVALPSQLFYNTDIPACLWLLSKNKTNNRYTNAGNEILFIDARKLGASAGLGKRELTNDDISLISKTYHRWRNINGDYTDIKGFCRSVSIKEIRRKGYILSPGRYIADKRVKPALLGLLSVILFAFFYFLIFKNGLLTSKSAIRDTAITIQSKPVKDSAQSEKKISKKEKNKAKDDSAQVKTDVAIAPSENKTVEISPPVEETLPSTEESTPVAKTSPSTEESPPVAKASPSTEESSPVRKTSPATQESSPIEKTSPPKAINSGATSYKVRSKAYFYNEPDENTRRNAYIIHWNNSYAAIKPLDEKNGFIYVVFINHLNQTSKGWLRKKDLTEVNQ